LFPVGAPEFAYTDAPVPYAPWCRQGELWTDPWGCVWETAMSGIIGAVTKHPLPTWENFSSYTPPDYMKTTHWYPVEWIPGDAPKGGSIGFFDCLRSGEIGHGHTVLKLFDIVGYQQAILELYDESPEIRQLLEMIEEFNAGLVHQFVHTAEVDWLGYAEDLGMQQGPLVSPELFRNYFMPSYKRLMREADRKDIIIHMHSDGDLSALIDDILTLPLQVLNLQDTVHGLEWIADKVKGKKVIDLDVDRVLINRESSLDRVREYLESIVTKLFSPEGGLILTYGLYPGVPEEIVCVLMDTLENMAAAGRQR
ncbi:MAG: hypothetical protein H8D65_00270, partial [Spirochaetes bacterium]|nr:hypothetical protein [Spirochaetota bacterium]